MVSSKSFYQTMRCPANAWKFDRTKKEQRHIEQTALECASNRIAQCAYVKTAAFKNGMRAVAGRRQSVHHTLLIMAWAYTPSAALLVKRVCFWEQVKPMGYFIFAVSGTAAYHCDFFIAYAASCRTSYIVRDLYRLCKWIIIFRCSNEPVQYHYLGCIQWVTLLPS